ncbi:hypothetical protein [Rhizobium laguerreae]|uniref:hypothetical protein n=1 Tax=Rhizobium TaxID=379 RepID=UPI0035E43109
MNAELIWDAENPAASRVSASIDPTSVRTDFHFSTSKILTKRSAMTGTFSRRSRSVSSRPRSSRLLITGGR